MERFLQQSSFNKLQRHCQNSKGFNNDGSKRRERREEGQILEGNSKYFKLSNSYDTDSEVDEKFEIFEG